MAEAQLPQEALPVCNAAGVPDAGAAVVSLNAAISVGAGAPLVITFTNNSFDFGIFVGFALVGINSGMPTMGTYVEPGFGTPSEFIDDDQVVPYRTFVTPIPDRDGDGIPDAQDQFPDDPTNTPPAWKFSGFQQPIDGGTTINTVKAGSAIPVKFGFGEDMGMNIFSGTGPKAAATVCNGAFPTDAIETTVSATSNSGLTYDSVTKQYTYVWKTDKAWSNTCMQLQIPLADGTTKTANFKFNKYVRPPPYNPRFR
jgi:hypothetical protein